MTDEIEKLVEEMGGVSYFRPKTADRRQDLKDSSFQTYEPERDTSMTMDQAKRLSDAAEAPVASTRFDSDDEFFELWERVEDEWTDVEVRFAGEIGEWGYLDTVFLVYEELSEQLHEIFEEYVVLHFKHSMRGGPEDNKGICPTCDERIEFDNECFRNDDHLWASPDEFDFREYPDFGQCARLWWDD